MPQLDFKTPLTISQVVWGAIIFVVLYILLSRTGLPLVASVLEERAAKISKDLDEARAAKASADAGMAEADQATAKARAESQAAINAALEEAKKAAAAQAETLNARLEKQLQDCRSADRPGPGLGHERAASGGDGNRRHGGDPADRDGPDPGAAGQRHRVGPGRPRHRLAVRRRRGSVLAAETAGASTMHHEESFFAEPRNWVVIAFILFFVLFGRKLWGALAGMLDARAVSGEGRTGGSVPAAAGSRSRCCATPKSSAPMRWPMPRR